MLEIVSRRGSYMLTAASSRPKTCNYGVGRRHHGSSMPQILLSSCGLIKHSSPSLLLLCLSDDLELNPGPAEGCQASYSLRPRCTTCNLAVKKNAGFVTCSECKLWFHLNCIGHQFENSGSFANCCTLSSASVKVENSSPYQDIPNLSEMSSRRGLKFLHLNAWPLLLLWL